MQIPAHHISRLQTFISPLLRRRWARELILVIPTLLGKRSTNKAEDYGAFRPARVSRLLQTAIYVSNIDRSRDWYQHVAGLVHSRTTPPEPNPLRLGQTLTCCYMSSREQAEDLVLIERRDEAGNVVPPSMNGFFHVAFELADTHTAVTFARQLRRQGKFINYGPVQHNDRAPLGDGETGGNIACYVYDPDGHFVEFFSEMDTVARH